MWRNYFNFSFNDLGRLWSDLMNDFSIEDKYGFGTFDYLEELLNYALKKLKIKTSVFTIIFVNEEEIKDLNKNYRGIDKITDVISFALNDNGKTPGPINVLGDIYVCIPQMQAQAKAYGHSEKRELSFLVLHGLLHLLGYDHQDPEAEKEMFTLQAEILEEKGINR